MSRTYPQMKLRMSPKLREAIETAATENGRSMNAEIVYRLQRSLDEGADGAGALTQKEAEALAKKFAEIAKRMASKKR